MKLPAFTSLVLASGAALILTQKPVQAQYAYTDFLTPTFSGTTSTDGWFGLNSTSYPNYLTFGTNTNAWPAPILSNQAGAGDAGLDKLARTSGYLTGASSSVIYSPDAALGTFIISDATPVTGLSSILLQISSTADLGPLALTLDYNAGTQNLAPTANKLLSATAISTAFGPATKYIWAYQWDVSSLNVTSFSATWSTVEEHNLTMGARLDQSSTYTQVIPEPSAWILLVVGIGAIGWSSWRRMGNEKTAIQD